MASWPNNYLFFVIEVYEGEQFLPVPKPMEKVRFTKTESGLFDTNKYVELGNKNHRLAFGSDHRNFSTPLSMYVEKVAHIWLVQRNQQSNGNL